MRREVIVQDGEKDPICLFFIHEASQQIEQGVGLF
jgi:hypothetical protein